MKGKNFSIEETASQIFVDNEKSKMYEVCLNPKKKQVSI